MARNRQFKAGRTPGSKQAPPARSAYGNVQIGNHLINLDRVNEDRDGLGHPHISAREARELATHHNPLQMTLQEFLAGPKPLGYVEPKRTPKPVLTGGGMRKPAHVEHPQED